MCLGKLRPVHMLWPAVLGQVLVFIVSLNLPVERALTTLAIGNLVVVALAISPMLFRSPRPERSRSTAHWV